jgi:hypothetical protein
MRELAYSYGINKGRHRDSVPHSGKEVVFKVKKLVVLLIEHLARQEWIDQEWDSRIPMNGVDHFQNLYFPCKQVSRGYSWTD